ncbi:MAG: small ribosomal subunit Rsm22 family protein [Ornithinibacter sp.]
MPSSLTSALESVLGSSSPEALRRATSTLMEVYRSGAPPTRQVLRDEVTATAYAAYRMPATYAALSRALAQALTVDPGVDVTSLVDVGGGTGAAIWAAAEAFPDLRSVSVLDGSRAALGLGRRVAAHGPPVLAAATWRHVDLTSDVVLPQADLASIGYVLGELDDSLHGPVVDAMASSARFALVIEPGTPRGYAAVLSARARLTAAGWHVLAPCPQSGACPLGGDDWCHFAARLDRSALHRRLKGAALGHEDEKFSFVFAARDPGTPGRGRVLRHPLTRKRLVQLEVCRPDGTAGTEIISRRAGPTYRHARGVGWGDEWPIGPEAVR